MESIAEICDAILNQHDRLGLSTRNELLPGLSEERIAALAKDLPFKLPAEAVELFRWRSGTARQTADCDFFPYYSLQSLEDAISIFLELGYDDEFPRFHGEQPIRFPLFESVGTDYYCIAIAPVDDGKHLIYFDPSDSAPTFKYSCLRSMLKCILAALERGIYYVGGEDTLTVGSRQYDLDGRLIKVDVSAYNTIIREVDPEAAAKRSDL